MKLNCPYCGVENTFDDSLYGQNIICGACSKVFVGKPASMASYRIHKAGLQHYQDIGKS